MTVATPVDQRCDVDPETRTSLDEVRTNVGEVRAQVGALVVGVEALDRRVAALELGVQGLDRRVAALEVGVAVLDRRVDTLDLKVDALRNEMLREFETREQNVRRHFDVAVEAFRSDFRASGEGVFGVIRRVDVLDAGHAQTRTRVDQLEVRVVALESPRRRPRRR